MVGESDQPMSSSEPDCHSVIDIHHQLDHHPYPDPLRSGEAVRFTPAGVPVDHGFMNHSYKDCTNGWLSDGDTPAGVAVDPNGGDVYVPNTLSERIDHLQPNLVDPDVSNGLPGAHVISIPCYVCGKQLGEAPIVASPLGAAFDCRSNLYVAFATGFLVKYLNLQPPASPKCHKQLPIEALSDQLHVVGGLAATGGNKGAEVKLGCTLHLCSGTLHIALPGCSLCAAAPPLRFKLKPGTQRSFTLRLRPRARTLLDSHPGLRLQLRAVIKGLKRPVRTTASLLEHVAVSAACRGPAAAGGATSVSGTLLPALPGRKVIVEYQSPDSSTVVRHRVLTTKAGRYSDTAALRTTGRWIIVVRWLGGGGFEPARSLECAATVPQLVPALTLSCPSTGSLNAVSSFTGNLSIAGRRLVVEYVAPSGLLTSHVVGGGGFTDQLVPKRARDVARVRGLGRRCRRRACDVGHLCLHGRPYADGGLVSCASSADKKAISCQGQLLANGAGLGGRPLTVTYENTDTGASTPHSVQTGAGGAYSDSLSALPGGLLLGNWQLTVQFAGETDYAPSSASQSITVSRLLALPGLVVP